MNPKAAGCLVLLAAAAGPAAAQTRTFPDAECSLSLPGKDWVWIDPKAISFAGPEVVAVARNGTGMVVVLEVQPLKADYRPGANPYRAFEEAVVRTAGREKLGARHLTFKGVPAYQVDVRGQTACLSVRGFYANQKFYCLELVNTIGLPPEAQAEAVFQKFAFVGTPRPMLPPVEGKDAPKGEKDPKPEDEVVVQDPPGLAGLLGNGVTGLGSLGLVLLIFFGAWAVIRVRG